MTIIILTLADLSPTEAPLTVMDDVVDGGRGGAFG